MSTPHSHRLVSADSHLEVSPDRWRPFVDPEFQKFVPQVVQLDNGGDAWKMPNSEDLIPLGLNYSAGRGWENLRTSGISYSENPPGSGDAAQRLAEMDRDGVYAEILFPAIAGQRGLDSCDLPAEAYVALARGYNDWLSEEYTAAAPDRLLGSAILPVTDVKDTVEELRRVATMPGIRTVVLHQWPNGLPHPSEEDDAFWAEVVALGVPLSVHVSFGGGERFDPRSGLNTAQPAKLLSRTGGTTGYCMTQLITTGVLDRHPDLRIAYAESGAGWVPYYKEQADTNYKRHRHWAGLELPHEPSWYVDKHFRFGIQDDYVSIRWRGDIGVDRIMWASDFPHVSTDWPNTAPLLDELFDGVPDDEVQRMVAGNAIDFYKLDVPS